MQSQEFAETALIVLAHGTEQNAGSAGPAVQQASELRCRGIFREVQAAFWKQSPQIKEVLARLTAPTVFIVPLFISEGYFSTEIIPTELGFPGVPATIQKGATSLHYCRPVGSHPSMTEVILARAATVVQQFPFPRAPKPKECTLFIAGHGTPRNANSRKAIERQVELIRARNIYAEVQSIFMEEPPLISHCHTLAQTKKIVVVPFFISDGLHVREDIPVLLGEPAKRVQERLAAGQPTWRNPTEKHGKLIWYASSVGTEPGLADVILERVREQNPNGIVST